LLKEIIMYVAVKLNKRNLNNKKKKLFI